MNWTCRKSTFSKNKKKNHVFFFLPKICVMLSRLKFIIKIISLNKKYKTRKKNTFNKVKVSKLEMNDLTYVAKEAESEMKLKKWTNEIKWMDELLTKISMKCRWGISLQNRGGGNKVNKQIIKILNNISCNKWLLLVIITKLSFWF